MKTLKISLLLTILLFGFNSCKKEEVLGFVFPVSDDVKLGAQVEAEIASKPAEYKVLDPAAYPAAYAQIQRITNNILNSGQVFHKTVFPWKVKIIQDDATLNAFCTPGGYIYVYTGIIKYLDTEDQLAGVMGHEIAHADRRHYVNQQIKNGATQFLISVVAGDKGAIGQLAGDFISKASSLAYSRADETDADNKSVEYLSGTATPKYACNSAGAFFQKLVDGGKADCNAITGFFSTHPCPENRVANINKQATEKQCSTTPSGSAEYAIFKASLPAN
ncbi:MAG: M48 family metalloprotease [Cytophagales bacterium]